MARTTRSKASASTAATQKSAVTASDNTSRYTLPAGSTNPPKLFILPTKATKDAKIVSLLNPRYAKPTRYLVCPDTGIYEFTGIAAPTSTPRSWLIQCNPTDELQRRTDNDATELGAYITKGADLYLATPVDPIFLVLPALTDTSNKVRTEKKLFVSSEDYFSYFTNHPDILPHFNEMLRWGNTLKLLESRMAVICDTVPVDDEMQFRFNMNKFFAEVLSKARKMSEQALPKSMEDKFVTKALEAPVMGVKRETTTLSVSQQTQTQTQAQTEASTTPGSQASTPKVESADSQSSASTMDNAVSSTTEVSTAATSIVEESATVTTTTTKLAPSIQASEEVIKLQRLRTSFDFICARYIAPSHTSTLRQKLLEQNVVDFAPLDAYLTQLAQLRQEAAAARSMGDYSRKRVLDEEERAGREEKKRKKEEEEKRKKAGESRGVRNLKKANTTGMKKMSDFFKKK
ncbi:hypothetical protein AAE478_008027 [Parahypoxylon ruwenzoriense]